MTKFLTPSAVVTQLGLAKPDAVFAWIKAGELKAVNVGSKPGGRPTWRIAEADLMAFLESRRATVIVPAPRRGRARRKAEKVTQYF